MTCTYSVHHVLQVSLCASLESLFFSKCPPVSWEAFTTELFFVLYHCLGVFPCFHDRGEMRPRDWSFLCTGTQCVSHCTFHETGQSRGRIFPRSWKHGKTPNSSVNSSGCPLPEYTKPKELSSSAASLRMPFYPIFAVLTWTKAICP